MKNLITYIVIMVLCTACATYSGGFAVEPLAVVPGYCRAGQELTGGSSGGSKAIQSITVEERLEETLITVICDGTPPVWSVRCLEAPGRIVLSVKDCAFPGKLPDAYGLLKGAFMDRDSLVLQFTGEIAYTAEEKNDSLVIVVRRELKDALEWFVLIDADAVNTDIPPPEGYSWALNADLSTLVLLSPPYESIDGARDALSALPATVPRAYAHVLRVEDGKLPPSYIENEATYYEGYTQLKLGDMEVDGRVWGVGTRFLCWQQSGSMALVARGVRMFGETHDELWQANADAQRALLTHGWSRIDSAACSGSGRYIAIVEAVDGMRLLYIYDTRREALYLMIEEGLGAYTASYAWNGDKLYAMNGDTQLQLLIIDPALEVDAPGRVTVAREQPEPFETIGLANGALYYIDEDSSSIYALDISSYESTLLTEGERFIVSPDGKHMAVSYYEPGVHDADDSDAQTGDEGDDAGAVYELTGLKVLNLETGACDEISSGVPLMGMAFSRDGQLLHYGVEDLGSEDAPCHLFSRRMGESTSIEQGFMRSAELYAGSQDDTIVAVGYYRAEQAYRAITYELNIIR